MNQIRSNLWIPATTPRVEAVSLPPFSTHHRFNTPGPPLISSWTNWTPPPPAVSANRWVGVLFSLCFPWINRFSDLDYEFTSSPFRPTTTLFDSPSPFGLPPPSHHSPLAPPGQPQLDVTKRGHCCTWMLYIYSVYLPCLKYYCNYVWPVSCGWVPVW